MPLGLKNKNEPIFTAYRSQS